MPLDPALPDPPAHGRCNPAAAGRRRRSRSTGPTAGRRWLAALGRGLVPGLGLSLAIMPAAAPAHVETLPASLSFATQVQGGMHDHLEQIRGRQQRLRDRLAPPVPVFTSGLTISDQDRSIPLRMRDAPRPGQARLAPPSSMRRFNGYARGNLQSDARPGTDSSLSTTDLTAGGDYRSSDYFTFGLAAGRLATASAAGTSFSAYLTLRPMARLYVDLSLSLGQHHARGDMLPGLALPMTRLSAQTRALSLSLKHPREFAGWVWQPYGRFDRMVTDIDGHDSSLTSVDATRDLAAFSVGGTAETLWSTPFGVLRPMLLIELQREVVNGNGLQVAGGNSHSLVGFGLSTRVSRDVSAFAQSRYAQDGGDALDRLVMLGLRFAF